MSFVTIPSQEDAVTRLTTATAAEHDKSKSPLDEEDEDEDEEDEDEDEDDHHTRDPRFIERRSPVPKKRGQSIFDETAEYLRIRLALPVVRRGVSFADTTGRDLVDVKEFVAFDSDEEEAEEQAEEAARYRKPQRKCTYQVKPDFALLTGDALMRAVRANRVEIEALSPVEDEPLAFSGIVRVLDISFDKAVYIRSTMDNWATYFDHPADYIQGSHDGGTDKFSFKLSFAPPYLTHGSRIEFVVRYETSDGDHWANNSQMNYAVALLVSYADEKAHAASDARELRGILRPPKDYSRPHHDDEDKLDKDEEHPDTSGSAPIKPTPVRPAVLQPELDLETADRPPGHLLPPNREPPSSDCSLPVNTVSLGGPSPCVSSKATLQTNEEFSFVSQASKPIWTTESEPLLGRHCEGHSQMSKEPKDISPSALLSGLTQPAPQPPVCSTDLDTGREEQETGSTIHGNPESATLLNPLDIEFQADIHLDSDITKEVQFPVIVDVGKVKHVLMGEKEVHKQDIRHTLKDEEPNSPVAAHGPPDSTIKSAKKPSEPKSSSQTQILRFDPAPFERNYTLSDPGSSKSELDTFQTEPKMILSISQAFDEEVGIPHVSYPSTKNVSPATTAISDEQSPYMSTKITSQNVGEESDVGPLSNQPSPPSSESQLERAETAVSLAEDREYLKKESSIKKDRENGQDCSTQVDKLITVPRYPAEDPQTEISQTSRKWSLMGRSDAAPSLEGSEEVTLTEAQREISVNEDGKFISVEVREPSIHSISPLVSHAEGSSPLSPSFPPEEARKTPMDDNADRRVASGAVDPMTYTRTGLDNLQTPGEKTHRLATLDMWSSTSGTHVGPAEARVSHNLACRSSPGSPFENVSSQCLKRSVVAGLSELPVRPDESSSSAVFSSGTQTQVSPGAAASPAPTDTSVAPDINEASCSLAWAAEEAEEHPLQVYPDTLLKNSPEASPQATEPVNLQAKPHADRNLVLSIISLGGAVVLSLVSEEFSFHVLLGLFVCLVLFLVSVRGLSSR